MTLNIQFVYGAGPDGGWLGEGLRELRDKVIAEFGEDVYVPDILDHRDTEELNQRVGAWEDPTVLIGHSCGVRAITDASVEHPEKHFPYLMGIATSKAKSCYPTPIGTNVVRATEIMANKNPFNWTKKQLLLSDETNNETKIKVIESGKGHVASSRAEVTHNTAIEEIRTAITNNQPPFVGV